MDAANAEVSAVSIENLARPKVKLVGGDGNAFAILGVVRKALRKAGWTQEQLEAFYKEATSGNYDRLLQTCMKYADVD
jgi:hypothetical protein